MSQLSTDPNTQDAINDPKAETGTNADVKDHTEEATTGDKPTSVPADQTAQVLMELASDPQIATILAARRDGREVEVVTKDSDISTPEADKPVSEQVDMSEFDEDVKKVVDILDKKITSSITPLLEKITALEGIAQTYGQRELADQISSVEKKHPDLKKYRTKMATLARAEGAGLSVEELLLLVKHREGDLNLANSSTESERPTPTPRPVTGARQTQATESSNIVNPRRRFQIQLADALEKIDFQPDTRV